MFNSKAFVFTDNDFVHELVDIHERFGNVEIRDNLVTAIDENIKESGTVIYPNPTDDKGMLQLNIQNTRYLDIAIYDILGKKMQQIESANFTKGIHNITFDTSNLESGTYFVKCQSEERVDNIKFVVAH